jgi:alkylation response protein AidB-like acyl-CoA dehydrogenase
MNFLLSDEQAQIVDSLHDLLTDQMPVSRFRPPAPQIGNSDLAFWPRLGESGFLGMGLSEEHGGSGLSAAEEMLAYREFGRYLLSPAILGLTLGARIAAHLRSDRLDEILEGRLSIALANPRGPVQLAEVCHGQFHLIDAKEAEWVLICCEDGSALLRRTDFTSVTDVSATDHVLSLERGLLSGARPVCWLANSQECLYPRAQLLISAYAVGMAEATRDMAVEYAKARQQFGKPIGSFQAIKHLCADMAIRAEAATCQVIFAALVQAEARSGADFHSAAAKLVAVEAALQNAQQNIQVHGAIGFTAEADAHLFVKRAHVLEQLWGDTRQQRRLMLAAPFPDG